MGQCMLRYLVSRLGKGLSRYDTEKIGAIGKVGEELIKFDLYLRRKATQQAGD